MLSIYNIHSMQYSSPSMKQGEIFQHRKESNKKKGMREGFTSNTNATTSSSTTNDELQQEYQIALQLYQELKNNIQGTVQDYIQRVEPSNPYLGKNVTFTDGTVAYVTNQGILKQYPSQQIYQANAGVNGCPNNAVQLTIPWSTQYVEGTTVPTNPPLIVGSPMISGQSCGFEGTNVFVNTLVANPASTYVGCYNNYANGSSSSSSSSSSNPAMTTAGQMTYAQCQTYAVANGNSFFGLQAVNDNGVGNCMVGTDQTTVEQYGNGITYTPVQLWSSQTEGQGSTALLTTTGALSVLDVNGNTVFSTTASSGSGSGSAYYFMVQPDGNACIYPGTAPTDTTNTDASGSVWCTNTAGQQQQNNPTYEATAGKYGQNWMPSSGTLAAGDFVGSTDGTTYLIMQSDGNLVYYTNTQATACTKNATTNLYSGQTNINATYQLTTTGTPASIGQLAYIDGNAAAHPYPTSQVAQTATYSLVLPGMDSLGNDIANAAYSSATLQSCQDTCTDLSGCSGFVMNSEETQCFPKTAAFYPGGSFAVNSDRNVYLRNSAPTSYPKGVPTTVDTMMDTWTYGNYVQGGQVGDQYGLASATSVQKQLLNQMETKLAQLSAQISQNTEAMNTATQQSQQTNQTNDAALLTTAESIQGMQEKIQSFAQNNIENILKDTNILILQKNQSYILWSALAILILLVAIYFICFKQKATPPTSYL